MNWLPIVCCMWLANAAVAQTTWFVRPSEAARHIVGPGMAVLRSSRSAATELPAGDYAVHFGTDAAGKPMSLAFAVADHAAVMVAVAAAGAVVAREVAEDGVGWSTFARQATVGKASWSGKCTASEVADYRVVATFCGGGPTSLHGLVARWQAEGQHYRFVWDRAANELRLERQFDTEIVLARAPAPATTGEAHVMSLQVHGFRLQACLDDAPVLHAFDGAFQKGGFGTWTATGVPDVTWQSILLEPPAAPRSSSALVRLPNSATFHAGTDVSPGHYHVLELLLDRPHALVPLTASGQELWLMQPPAAPRVLWADWRNSLGAESLGEVPRDGILASSVHWPTLVGLRHQCALVRALLVSPDGELVVGATPAVPLWL